MTLSENRCERNTSQLILQGQVYPDIKTNKDIIRKNYRPILPMKIGANTCNKISVNRLSNTLDLHANTLQ